MILVVDASVAVECLLRTTLGQRIAPTLAAADLVAPELLDVEVVSALRRGERTGKLTAERAREAVADLGAWSIVRITHGELVADAWSYRHQVSVYDAFYLAAARRHAAAVITADGPLSRAPALDVLVQNVRG